MKIIYATRVDISASNAQSLQVKSMSKAFFDLLGNNFKLIAFSNTTDCVHPDNRCRFVRLRVSFSIARQIIISILAIYESIRTPDAIVYTRDIFVAIASCILDRTVVYEAHKLPASFFPKILTKLYLTIGRTRLVVISAALGTAYEKNFCISRNKYLVAHDAVFVDRFSKIQQEQLAKFKGSLRIPDGKILAVHTGSLYKGGAEIFEYIIRASNEKIYILHVGGSEKETNAWSEFYKNRGYNNIAFLPSKPADDIKNYQLVADLLIYINVRSSPIYWCTSPLKLFEYMLSGRPILGSAIGSVSEIINESNAFCFDPDNETTISSAVDQLISSPDEADRRATLARELVMKCYTWDNRAKLIVSFINA